eukprot:352664-Chlamydomonas_euryale.AAC.9
MDSVTNSPVANGPVASRGVGRKYKNGQSKVSSRHMVVCALATSHGGALATIRGCARAEGASRRTSHSACVQPRPGVCTAAAVAAACMVGTMLQWSTT